jgi:hypothetical protein
MKAFTKNLSKVLFLAIISLFLMVNTGCEEEDPVDAIIGTWTLYEVEMALPTGVVTVSPTVFGLSITVIINDDFTYAATIIETTEEDPETDLEFGTWSRTDKSTVVITPTSSDDSPTTLIKDGDYYVVNDTKEGVPVNMRFAKASKASL